MVVGETWAPRRRNGDECTDRTDRRPDDDDVFEKRIDREGLNVGCRPGPSRRVKRDEI
jgi:hypothetical protein